MVRAARDPPTRVGDNSLGRAGLPLWLRSRVLLHPGFRNKTASSAQIAMDLGGALSERTIRRYRQRYEASGTVGRRISRSGRIPNIHGEPESLLRRIVAWRSDLFLDELVSLLNAVYGPEHTFTRRQVHESFRRMNFVLVRKEWRNVNARYEEQWAWFNKPPVGPPRSRGIVGVPTAAMVDMDETVVRLGGLRRTMARTVRGSRAICRDVTDFVGVSYSVILATDINVGVVAYMIIPATINRERYLHFLQEALFPRLGNVRRYLLMDNASSHHGQAVLDACEALGHVVLYRPAYSPHLAWIEQQNSLLKGALRRCYASLTHENIAREIERAILESITPEKVRAAAAHCHYRVPGYPYHPWPGD